MKTAYVHGRFQPFHLDHLAYVLAALARYNRIGIGLTGLESPEGASPYIPPHRSMLGSNPYSYVQRMEMISQALSAEGVKPDCYFFVPFPIERPSLISSIVGQEAIMVTTVRDQWNLQKVEFLRKSGYDVDVLFEDFHKVISGTVIRRLFQEGAAGWESMVPIAVAKFMLQHRRSLTMAEVHS